MVCYGWEGTEKAFKKSARRQWMCRNIDLGLKTKRLKTLTWARLDAELAEQLKQRGITMGESKRRSMVLIKLKSTTIRFAADISWSRELMEVSMEWSST